MARTGGCSKNAIDRLMGGGFYSIIRFPDLGPLKDSDLNATFASWRWVSFVTAPKS